LVGCKSVAFNVAFTNAQLNTLELASAISGSFPHDILGSDHVKNVTRGNLTIKSRRK